MPKKLLLLITLTLLLGVSIVWLWCQEKKGETPPVTPPVQTLPETSSSESQSIDTSDWKTYRNEEYGFEFKYPKKVFYLTELVGGAGELNIRIIQRSHEDKDIELPGGMGIILNGLMTSKYAFAKDHNLCVDVVVFDRRGEICAESTTSEAKEQEKQALLTFMEYGTCAESVGVLFFEPVYTHEEPSRQNNVYVTCDTKNPEIMKLLQTTFNSIQFFEK